jgi:hypothetical protein
LVYRQDDCPIRWMNGLKGAREVLRMR